jgi:hypothetical protein
VRTTFKAEQEEQAQGQGHPANPGHRRGDADAFRHYANKASEQGYQSLLIVPDAGNPASQGIGHYGLH